jgi:hypothetical protein
MLDRTRWALSADDLDHLKGDPEAANAARWIPMLVAEVERLREQMKLRRLRSPDTTPRHTNLGAPGARPHGDERRASRGCRLLASSQTRAGHAEGDVRSSPRQPYSGRRRR